MDSLSTRKSFRKLYQPSPRTEYGKKSFSYIGPSHWNKLEKDIKEVENLNTFKHDLKKYFLNQRRTNDENICTF